MNLKLIKPKELNVSDKYSSNLYKYLSKNKKDVRVYYSKINSFTEEPHTYSKDSLVKVDTLFGFLPDEGLIGSRLIEILRKVPKNDFYYIGVKDSYVDITEEFFKDYAEMGRCLFDNTHDGWLRNTDSRFAYTNEDSRVCNWCGLEQDKHIEIVTKEVVVWK